MLYRLFRLWRSMRKISCQDFWFKSDPELDKLCEKFDGLLQQQWFAMMENRQDIVNELIAKQKAVQEEGGDALKQYLALYFQMAKIKDEDTATYVGWQRWRTANNWRE